MAGGRTRGQVPMGGMEGGRGRLCSCLWVALVVDSVVEQPDRERGPLSTANGRGSKRPHSDGTHGTGRQARQESTSHAQLWPRPFACVRLLLLTSGSRVVDSSNDQQGREEMIDMYICLVSVLRKRFPTCCICTVDENDAIAPCMGILP